MAEKNKLTPIMQQYVDMKAENPDALLMFRLGDFYEVFFEDAKIASRALDLVLTRRGKDENDEDIPMCGVPWHAADNYFGRLVRAGFKVALVEQMETPDQAKARGHKFIERSVVRVLTPGTLTDENLLTPKKSNFLVAVFPDENSLFNIAGLDISTGEFFAGKSHDVFDELVRINPAEIIYPESLAEDKQIIKIRDNFKTSPVYEKLYNRSDINTVISKTLGANLNYEFINSGLLALLAGYLFNTQRGANIICKSPYDFKAGHQLLVDSATWKSLEIDASINDGGLCLLDILDKTKTAAGARKMRSYLRSLCADVSEIMRRQEHIGHLLINTDIKNMLADVLSSVPDVGRSLTRILSGRGSPRDMRSICDFMYLLPDIKSSGQKLDSVLAEKFSNINPHNELTAELKDCLNEQLPTFFRDGGVIRDGFDIALDNQRKFSNGARETVAGLQSQYINQTGVNTLKIKYNNMLGYFIEVPSTRADTMMRPDSGFIHRQTMAGNMRFTTAPLIELDNQIRGASERAFAIEEQIINTLIDKIRTVSQDILFAADLIADADVWLSLTIVAERYSWVRPEINNSRDFKIVGGRHPVIEYALLRTSDRFVKNDCNLGDKSIALLTGPNMAGKSTYLRQNAIITVLAHMGSFVPADSAVIGVCDQLFSRVGASDNLAAGQSTFMVEMVETANILNRATDKSFIIFDEIGRGTATYDGMAIAQAVLEFLNNLKPRTLFATHYHELTELEFKYVKNLTVQVREHNDQIIFMHKITDGVANKSYGIHVAQMAGMPSFVVSRAESVLRDLEKTVVVAPENIEKIIDEPGVKPHKVSENITKKPQLNLFGE